MNAHINTSKLGNFGSFGALAVAFASLSAVVYVMLSGIGVA